MNYFMTQDENWLEAYRTHETERLEAQMTDPLHSLDLQRLSALCLEAIEHRWAKHCPRTAERMKVLFQIRLIDEKTLEECGGVLDVTSQRVRQMEMQLVKAVREHLRRLGVKP